MFVVVVGLSFKIEWSAAVWLSQPAEAEAIKHALGCQTQQQQQQHTDKCNHQKRTTHILANSTAGNASPAAFTGSDNAAGSNRDARLNHATPGAGAVCVVCVVDCGTVAFVYS